MKNVLEYFSLRIMCCRVNFSEAYWEKFGRQIQTAAFILASLFTDCFLASCSLIGQFTLTESINKSSKLSYVLYPFQGVCLSGFSPLRLSRCASAFDGWVEVGGFGSRPLWGGVTRVYPWSSQGDTMGTTQFFDWPGMGLDLCRASHVKRPCATFCLVGDKSITIPFLGGLPHSGFSPLRLSRCASAFDGWVEVGGFGCRPLWGEVTRVHPWASWGEPSWLPEWESIGSTQFLDWPGIGLDLCRAPHVKRPCAIFCLVGDK